MKWLFVLGTRNWDAERDEVVMRIIEASSEQAALEKGDELRDEMLTELGKRLKLENVVDYDHPDACESCKVDDDGDEPCPGCKAVSVEQPECEIEFVIPIGDRVAIYNQVPDTHVDASALSLVLQPVKYA